MIEAWHYNWELTTMYVSYALSLGFVSWKAFLRRSALLDIYPNLGSTTRFQKLAKTSEIVQSSHAKVDSRRYSRAQTYLGSTLPRWPATYKNPKIHFMWI